MKFNQSGTFIAKLGDSTTGLGHSGSGFTPFNIAIGSDGSIYAAYSGVNKIAKFSNSGAFLLEWGTSGSGDGQFSAPRGIAVDSNNNVYVADSYNSRVQKFDSNGTFLTKWGSRGNGNGQFTQAYGIFVDSANDVWVTSAGDGNESVQKFTGSGTFISKFGSARGNANGQFSYPEGVAVDDAKNIYIADTNNARIQKFDGKIGSGPVSFWNFNDSDATVARDTVGSNNGTIYGATRSEGALSFNGSGDYVKVPDSSSLNPATAITISMWVKPLALRGIGLNKELQYRLIAEDVSSSNLSARVRTTNTNWGAMVGGAGMAVNSWQHVVLTYNGSKWKLYYNGQLDSEMADSGSIASSYSDDGNLYFGHIGPNRGRNSDLFYKGLLDDIKLYDRALSASEISADYNSGRTVPPTCTSWTYSEWNACPANGQQTRSIVSSSPAGCIGGTPSINQSCTYIPPCTASSWQCGDWNSCSVDGNQSRTCSKASACEGGVVSPSITQSCTYVPPTCTSWTYSDWSACGVDGKQIRSVLSSSPSNCTGGNPSVSQSCTYTPPCTEDKWECVNWNQCSADGKQSRSCTRTFDCAAANTSSPSTTQTCTPPQENKNNTPTPQPTQPVQPQCTEDKWECGSWNACSPMGIQSRSCKKTFDCPSVESEIPATSQYCTAPGNNNNDNNGQTVNQDNIIKATVKLWCGDKTRIKTSGSGTVVSSDGKILTNKHVIDGMIGCLVGFINSASDMPSVSKDQFADIIETSPDADIAILKMRNANNLTYVNIKGNSVNPNMVGQRLTVYGYPGIGGNSLTYSSGDLSGFLENYIKTTAFMEHGNSGGGAYLKNGTYIGIPSGGITGEVSSIGLILSINKINLWLSGVNFDQKVQDNVELQNIWNTADSKSANQAIQPVDISKVKVLIYSSISKSQLLPNVQEYPQDASQPVFQIRNENTIDGYYVYFGPDITADPVMSGTFISKNDYSPNPITNDGTYYFIFKAKKGDAVSSNVITEYRYQKPLPKKTEEKKGNATGQSMASRLRGNILLQVESHGEAYYVNPNNEKRYSLGRPADAFQIMRELGLGASHDFVVKYKKGTYPDNVIGKILIDVGDSGKAYYIYPKNKRAYYLGRPSDAFKVMRELGLGITNSDLERIAVSQ